MEFQEGQKVKLSILGIPEKPNPSRIARLMLDEKKVVEATVTKVDRDVKDFKFLVDPSDLVLPFYACGYAANYYSELVTGKADEVEITDEDGIVWCATTCRDPRYSLRSVNVIFSNGNTVDVAKIKE